MTQNARVVALHAGTRRGATVAPPLPAQRPRPEPDPVGPPPADTPADVAPEPTEAEPTPLPATTDTTELDTTELDTAPAGPHGTAVETAEPDTAEPDTGPATAPETTLPRPSTIAPAGDPTPIERVLGTVAELAEFCHRRLGGDYEVDEFGFDPELTETVVLPALRTLYDHWFRVEVTGAENLPADGAALLVANHSGTLPFDALMTAVAVHDHSPGHRHLRQLGADLIFATPVLGMLARKSGQTLACGPDAERLLNDGQLVGVWPEGFKGIGKPFSARYKLQRFGRGGFVTTAVRAGAPIIPVSIVGAEEIYPKIGDLGPVARLLGLPYVPITPTFPWLGLLGLVPLPTKWRIHFGTPIHTDGLAESEDPMERFNLADQVRETIQETLYRMLDQRGNAFLG